MKLVLLLAFLFPMQAAAAASAETEADLQRLFTTADQRAGLDHPSPARRAPAKRRTEDVRVDGVLRRADGRSMVWLNGKLADESLDLDGRTPDRIRVRNAAGQVEEVPVGSHYLGVPAAAGR